MLLKKQRVTKFFPFIHEKVAFTLTMENMNYYRLNDKFILRGWDEFPYAVVDTQDNKPQFLDKRKFNALTLCNGLVDLSLPFISEHDRKIIREFEKIGIVEPCTKGQKLNVDQEYKKFPIHYVPRVLWSITGKCNFRCKHCYLSGAEDKYGELSHDTVMNIIQQIADCGIMEVALTGGEPLVRDDFFEIVDALLARNIKIPQIYSNAYLIDEKFLAALKARNTHPNIILSYDGKGWHDWLRGVEGAEAAIERAVPLCRDYGFDVWVEMCIHRLNRNSIRDSVNFIASLGAQKMRIAGIMEAGDWNKNKADNSLTSQEILDAVLDYIPQYYADNMPIDIDLASSFTATPEKPDEFQVPSFRKDLTPERNICGCARNILYISPEGRVLPCVPMSGTKVEQMMPFIQDIGLMECINHTAWFQIVSTKIKDFFAVHDECKSCEWQKNCWGGCRAEALRVEPDNYLAKSPSMCYFLLNNWAQKVIDKVKQVRPDVKVA